jgi:hypothetical protein
LTKGLLRFINYFITGGRGIEDMALYQAAVQGNSFYVVGFSFRSTDLGLQEICAVG